MLCRRQLWVYPYCACYPRQSPRHCPRAACRRCYHPPSWTYQRPSHAFYLVSPACVRHASSIHEHPAARLLPSAQLLPLPEWRYAAIPSQEGFCFRIERKRQCKQSSSGRGEQVHPLPKLPQLQVWQCLRFPSPSPCPLLSRPWSEWLHSSRLRRLSAVPSCACTLLYA